MEGAPRDANGPVDIPGIASRVIHDHSRCSAAVEEGKGLDEVNLHLRRTVKESYKLRK